MYKSKPVIILSTFSKRELKLFEEYILSPFFNKKAEVITLFNLLKKQYPHFKEQQLEKQKIFKKVFPKLAFKEQKLRYLMSDLTKLLESFLAYQEYNQQTNHYNPYLLDAYMNRELDKYFHNTSSIFQNNINKNQRQNIDFHLDNFQIIKQKFDLHAARANHLPRNIRNDLLKSMLDSIDTFYIANKLKYSCEIYNNHNVLASDIEDTLLLDEIIQYLKTHEEISSPSVAIYYKILMTLLESKVEEHYNELINLLKKYEPHFTKNELYDMYIFARNYCIKKLNNGDAIYVRKSFDLHKILMANKVILRENYISEWDYKNIVQMSLGLGEDDFAEQFINDYKNNIRPEFRENAYNYNMATIHYIRKNYSKAQNLLHQVTFTDPYYHLGTKILLLKCYYELEEVIPLFNLIDTVKAFLRRNKQLSKSNKVIYLNLFKLVKKMIRIKMGSKKSLGALKAEIAQISQFKEASWLYAKVQELEKSRRR